MPDIRSEVAKSRYVVEGVDSLVPPYERLRFDLPDDREGRVTATVVRRRAFLVDNRAVLMIHVLADYF